MSIPNFDHVGKFVHVAAKTSSWKPVDFAENSVRQTHRLMKLSYEDDEKKADKLTLTIDNSDLHHLDSPLWREGNLVRVGWGFGGIVSPTRECTIEKTKASGRTLIVEARGAELQANKVYEQNTWTNVTRSAVARHLARKMGFTPDQMWIQDTKVVFSKITHPRMTRAQFLRKLADREGFEFYIDFDGFHFHERNLNQKPQMTLRYFVAGSSERSDIISYTIEKGCSATLPGSIIMMGRDPLTKEDLVYIAGNDTVQRTTLGAALAIVAPDAASEEPLASRTGTSVIMPCTELNAEALARFARGLYKRIQLGAVDLTVKTRGHPSLLAKAIVDIQGLGPTLSGSYYITNVKHDVFPAPYTMTLKLKRDAQSMAVVPTAEPLAGQGEGVTSLGQVNKQDVAESGQLTAKQNADGEVEYHVVGRVNLPREA